MDMDNSISNCNFVKVIGDFYLDNLDIVASSPYTSSSESPDQSCLCQVCGSPIRKGTLRFGEYFWPAQHHVNGRLAHGPSRRFYHEACVLQRVDFATMPAWQRQRLDQRRTELLQEYDSARQRLVRHEQRQPPLVHQCLNQLIILLNNSLLSESSTNALTTKNYYELWSEDICFKLPATHAQLLNCLHITNSSSNHHKILQVIRQYQKDQQEEHHHEDRQEDVTKTTTGTDDDDSLMLPKETLCGQKHRGTDRLAGLETQYSCLSPHPKRFKCDDHDDIYCMMIDDSSI
jgi:hypothetical protein